MKKTVRAGMLLAMLGVLPMNTVSDAADFAALRSALPQSTSGASAPCCTSRHSRSAIGIRSKQRCSSWPAVDGDHRIDDRSMAVAAHDAGLLGHRDLCAGTVALAPTHARDDVAGLLIALSNRVDPESAKFF